VGAVAASPQRLIFGGARTIDAICARLGNAQRSSDMLDNLGEIG
jgi:hypothetical protein